MAGTAEPRKLGHIGHAVVCVFQQGAALQLAVELTLQDPGNLNFLVPMPADVAVFKVRKIVQLIAAEGGAFTEVRADLSDFAAIQSILDRVHAEADHIDILVNNAGIIKRCDAIDVTPADWDAVDFLNEKMVFFLSQAVAKPWIADKKGGKIINIASMLSFQGGIRVPAYTSTKSAVMGMTKALANEWAQYGINVNAIAPGYMATNNTNQLRQDETRSEEILARIPAGRWGIPADVAGAAVFLASDAACYVNGHTLAVDGGWLAR